jgi:hypothetical protein
MQLSLIPKPESQNARARDACASAGGSIADLVALVERLAVERRSVNQIVAAVRAFEARAATPVAPASVWLPSGSPEWKAWAAYRGKPAPIDRNGGWRFPSQWPPTIQAAE